MYKIAIAGAGAMGGRIGVSIKDAGYDVTLIDNWEEHVKRINTKGMEIKTENDTFFVNLPAVLTKDISTKFDLIIILTKAMASEEMLQSLHEAGCIHNDTAILSMMNGLGHEERLSQIVPLSQIYLAVTMWTAGLRGPGQLLLEGEGSIYLQRADGAMDAHTNTILQILNDSGLNAQISTNVFEAIWSKATLNSVLNPLCTILNKTIYEFGNDAYSNEIVMAIIEEIVAVAKAKGIHLDNNALLKKLNYPIPKMRKASTIHRCIKTIQTAV